MRSILSSILSLSCTALRFVFWNINLERKFALKYTQTNINILNTKKIHVLIPTPLTIKSSDNITKPIAIVTNCPIPNSFKIAVVVCSWKSLSYSLFALGLNPLTNPLGYLRIFHFQMVDIFTNKLVRKFVSKALICCFNCILFLVHTTSLGLNLVPMISSYSSTMPLPSSSCPTTLVFFTLLLISFSTRNAYILANVPNLYFLMILSISRLILFLNARNFFFPYP